MAFELQGHRGARGSRPENTLPSFEYALDVGVDSVETDIHLTADGVPVLFHDSCLNERMCREIATGAPAEPMRIQDFSLAQLRRYRAIGNPDPRRFPRQEPIVGPLTAMVALDLAMDPYAIPTLADLFAFVQAYCGEAGKRAGKSVQQQRKAERLILDIELKRVPFAPENIGDDFLGTEPDLLERHVVEEIRQAGLLNRCRVRSFDHRSAAAMKQLEPALATAVLIADTAPLAPGQLARVAGAEFYCPDYRFVDEDLVRRVHEVGVRIMPWTVNDPAAWKRLIAWGVDGITTDFPDMFS